MGKIIIAGDGSGEFNCGKTDAHIQINKALAYQIENPSESVYLKGPFRYVIDSPLLLGNRILLEGDPSACITLKNNNTWAKNIPLIKQKSPSQSNPGKITIRGFEVDGNHAGNASKPRGNSYHTLFWLYYSDIEISNMYLHDSHNDGLKVQYSNSVKFHDNNIFKLGHEGMYAIQCQNIDYYNNTCRTKTNSACRLYNSNHAKIHDNKIYTEFEEDAGGPGIQMQYTRAASKNVIMDDIEVFNNTISNTYGPGIWLVGLGEPYAKEEACNVKIHDNTFTGCGTHKTYDWLAGIETSGFYDTLIENNVFDGCYGAGVLVKKALGLKSNGTGGKYNTIIRNNIIKNSIKMKCGVGGQGIRNETPSDHTVTSEGNYIFDNVSGPYFNVSGKDFLYSPPGTPEEPDKPGFVMLECTEEELKRIRESNPNRTILRGLE